MWNWKALRKKVQFLRYTSDMDTVREGTILLLEDNPAHLMMTKRVIKAGLPGFRIVEASKVTHAVELLEQGTLPDLFILDLKLDAESGLDFLACLRASPKWKNSPALVLSTSTYYKDIENSYSTGASSYLFKDNDMEEFSSSLIGALNYFLNP